MISRITHKARLTILPWLLLPALGVITPAFVAAQSDDEGTWSDIFSDDATCYEATTFSQQFIPYYMFNDEPDSLLETIHFWESNCGSAEPIRRFRILASIWDDAFTEDLYDTRLIDDLVWLYDPARLRAQEDGEYSHLGKGGVASVVDFFADAAGFDAFTADIADQLLPHMDQGSVEQFFCLFYSRRTDQAFALLDGEALVETELYRRYHLELSDLKRPTWRDFWGLTSGYWRPMGKLGRVGNHTGCGLFAGRRWSRCTSRIELSLRLGRAAEPYYVITHDFWGQSDRYGGVKVMFDTGPTLMRIGNRTRLDLLFGGGAEALNPFKDEETIVLTTFQGHLGAGLHVDLGRSESWFLELDWRREWISDPPEEGTVLGGDAWNIRFSLGFFLKSRDERRLEGLGR